MTPTINTSNSHKLGYFGEPWTSRGRREGDRRLRFYCEPEQRGNLYSESAENRGL